MTTNASPLDDDMELDAILRGIKAMYVDANAVSGEEEIYNFENGKKAIHAWAAKQAVESVITELESLYDYATNGTRVKTLLGYRIKELRTATLQQGESQ